MRVYFCSLSCRPPCWRCLLFWPRTHCPQLANQRRAELRREGGKISQISSPRSLLLWLAQFFYTLFARRMPFVVPPVDERTSVVVCHSGAEGCLHVRLLPDKWPQLQNDIKCAMAKQDDGDQVVDMYPSGTFVAARHKTDNDWHRGRVIESTATTVTVAFIDLGDQCRLPIAGAICPLPPGLARHPRSLAVKCKLKDVGPYDPKTWEAVTSFVTEIKPDQAMFGAVNSDGVYPIQLYANQGKDDVNAMLDKFFAVGSHLRAKSPPLDSGRDDLLRNWSASSSRSRTSNLDQSQRRVRSKTDLERILCMTRKTLSKDCLQDSVRISCVDVSLKLIFVQLEKEVQLIETIDTVLNFEKPVALGQIKEGLLCAAKYQDCFFRAKIVSTRDDDLCLVYFVDWGNCDLVSVSDLSVLPLKCQSPKDGAVAVRLFGVEENDLERNGLRMLGQIGWKNISMQTVQQDGDGIWCVSFALEDENGDAHDASSLLHWAKIENTD